MVNKQKGIINRIEVDGKVLPLTGGPRFSVGELEVSKMELDGNNGQATFWFKKEGSKRQARNYIRISLLPSEWVKIDYSFDVGGHYPHIGVTFDFPEETVKSVKWLGNGPYRVWKNRMKGVTFGLWEKDYNNTLTGESWEYPEFKGFHSKLYAADLSTTLGTLKIVAEEDDMFLHLFTPGKQVQRNNDNTLGVFPNGQLSVLNAISPVGTKFKNARELGPQSQPNQMVSSDHADPLTGCFYLKFEPKK